MMSDPSQSESLIDQLDQMQDEVLQGLDDLDARILALIKQCTDANARQLQLAEPGEELPEAA